MITNVSDYQINEDGFVRIITNLTELSITDAIHSRHRSLLIVISIEFQGNRAEALVRNYLFWPQSNRQSYDDLTSNLVIILLCVQFDISIFFINYK